MQAVSLSQSKYAILENISWKTYESLLEDYRGFRGTRLMYDRGRLGFMTPGPDHEFFSGSAGDLVKMVAEVSDTDITPLGSTTYKRKDLERGFEPDACFYFDDAAEMCVKTSIDLTVDPPHDLVIEIDDTSSSLDKMELFARMGIREVWRYWNGSMTISVLKEGEYVEALGSVALPLLTQSALNDFLAQSRTMRRPDWMRAVRAWAETQLSSQA